MKVKDLIKQLKQYDPEQEVFIMEGLNTTFITEQITFEEAELDGKRIIVVK
ncbi:hypothetical protein IHV09_22110 [Fictibacillus sp. 23RED33]|uniref:hypothetical protein n=1 Tax=Fictibacillus sp. 23RED33 TaxID=2745879 RepID=UPI0018CE68A4|nr:hypothetical protein [Fictibacillus sp. 23RED33]MBH0176255.1 hypothetical protein [Fictibacillus sp. 23RED33]